MEVNKKLINSQEFSLPVTMYKDKKGKYSSKKMKFTLKAVNKFI
jgi:hypothetical protein